MEIFTAKEENKCTEKDRERERMDRPLLDKYCETQSRGSGVFIADININFPGVALLAQRELGTEKLERKFSKPPGREIKDPGSETSDTLNCSLTPPLFLVPTHKHTCKP